MYKIIWFNIQVYRNSINEYMKYTLEEYITDLKNMIY